MSESNTDAEYWKALAANAEQQRDDYKNLYGCLCEVQAADLIEWDRKVTEARNKETERCLMIIGLAVDLIADSECGPIYEAIAKIEGGV